MSELIVVAFDDKHRADEVILDALKQDFVSVEGVEDVVTLIKDETGKIRVKPYYDLLGNQQGVKNEFWGTLISTLLTGFDNEVSDRLGITRQEITKLQEMLEPNTSAIFVLRRRFNPERLINLVKKYQGSVLYLSLEGETEGELLDAMAKSAK